MCVCPLGAWDRMCYLIVALRGSANHRSEGVHFLTMYSINRLISIYISVINHLKHTQINVSLGVLVCLGYPVGNQMDTIETGFGFDETIFSFLKPTKPN